MTNQTDIRVLLVNNSPADATLVREALAQSSRAAFLVTCVSCLSDAFAHLRKDRFDVLLLDLDLPDSAGLDTLVPLCLSGPPVLVLADSHDEAVETAVRQEGAQDYLIKTEWQAPVLARAILHAIERHRLRAALQSSEERLSAVLNSPTDAIIMVDEQQQICLFNAAAEQLFEVRSEDALGQPLDRFIPARFRDVHREHVREFGRTNVTKRNTSALGVLYGLRSDGTEFPIEASISMHETGAGKRFTVILRDITERQRAEEARGRLAAIVQSSDDAIIGETLDGVLTSWNPAAMRLYGYTNEEMIGQPISRLIPAERAAELDHELELVRAGQGLQYLETARIRKDGLQTDVSITVSPIKNDDGEITGASLIARDITERKLEKALSDGQRHVMEMIVAGAPLTETLETLLGYVESYSREMYCSILLLDEDGIHLRHSAAPRLPLEYTQAIDGAPIGDSTGSCGTAAYRREPVFVRDIATDPLWIDYRDAALKHGLRACWSTPIMDGQGKVLGTFAIYYLEPGLPSPRHLMLIDIVTHTAAIGIARHRTEFALRESERHLEHAQRIAHLGYIAIDAVTGKPIWSAETFRILGHEPNSFEPTVSSLTDQVHPLDGPKLSETRRRLIKDGEAFQSEYRIVRPSGEVRWVFAQGEAILDASGKPVRYAGIILDITERKKAERRLASQAAISQVLAESGSLGEASPRIIQALCEVEGWDMGVVWEVDRRAEALRCVDVWRNPDLPLDELELQIRRIMFPKGQGLPGRVWAGKGALMLGVSQASSYPRAALARQAGLKTGLGFPIMLGGEVTGVIEFAGHDAREPDPRLLEMLMTIGNQIGQFIERCRAQQHADRFVSLSPAVIYALKIEDGRLLHTWTSDNVLGLTGFSSDEAIGPDWWAANIHEEDRDRILGAHRVPYEIEDQMLEYRFRRKDGSYFWMRDEKRLLRTASGEPAEIVGSWSDITERIQLEKQLWQSQKMEAIGQLAGGVAHDFNNLLTVIIGYSALLMTSLGAGDPMRELVASVQQAGERAAALTSQLLAFSRKQVLELKVLDLNDVVSDLEKMLRRLIGENILLSVNPSPSAVRVRVDPGQMQQVLMNLAVNARDAMPDGGRLTIETNDVYLDEAYCRLNMDMRPGRYTLLSISDTGCGMTAEVKSRIFEPFFTTKESGKGTGLGLATVFGIVKQSECHIEVDSAPGAGACFKIYFPAVDAAATPESRSAVEAAPGGHETILLAEDEDPVRRITKIALDAQGYQVLEARDGQNALEVLAAHTGPVHLLIADVIMPRMGGRMLAEILHRERPDLKVLFISGYVDDALVQQGIIEGKEEFLRKPFSPMSLARKVRQVLDAAARHA